MLAEAKILSPSKRETIVRNLNSSENNTLFADFAFKRMKEWVADLTFWQGEANNYLRLVKIGENLEELKNGNESPIQFLDNLVRITMPKLLQSIKRLRKQNKNFDLKDFELAQSEYDKLKRQFARAKSAVLVKVIEAYPITLF